MKRRSKGTSFEIRGDEQEQHRIQLENNLQSTELSFHISTDDEQGQPARRRNSSVEYPRHISEPSFAEFPSFAHRSINHSAGEDVHSPHAWSYRTGDDEEGIISPYGGETMSTAAHHASVVTIGTGLGGGRAARTREPSLSGAEYDPDRPLRTMMSGVNSKHSLLDVDHSKSKHHITLDPVVVDSAVELDRLLESGHAPPPANRSRSVRLTVPPISSTSSTSDSEGPECHPSSRPKLTDHLRHISFSPKRPRSTQGFSPTAPTIRPTRKVSTEESNRSMSLPTPRPAKRTNMNTSSPAKPEVRLHPATPSTAGSKFTRMAKGITREIGETQQQIASSRQTASMSRPASVPIERNPFHDEHDPPTRSRIPTPRKSSLRDTTKSRMHLPDVTGLTSAVESPLRYGVQYYPYNADNKMRDNEARLLHTLSTVQAQLHDLEEENAISRRRVHELELELEECKQDVARERTRLMERETSKRPDISYRASGSSKAKGKSKAKDASGFGLPELDDERLRVRYKEAVDEKKALEALVNSLRSHLTRLTAELSSHQILLAELRKLREQDARALREKGDEILQLKEEVQRLAGEVEVLRGVVEEGLKERRASKESIRVEREDLEEDTGHAEYSQVEPSRDQSHRQEEPDEAGATQDEEEGVEDLEEEGQDTEIFEPAAVDKTMRTDRATFGESTNSNRANVQFVDDDDLEKIAAEVEERRSNRSDGSISYNILRSPSPVRTTNRGTVENPVEPDTRQPARLPEPSIISRPPAPTPGHASRFQDQQAVRDRDPVDSDPETPFPRIRGKHLEKLFFSAPEHNAKTCTVCHRRRHRPHGGVSPLWSKPSESMRARTQQKNVDEDHDGGSGGDRHGPSEPSASKGKQREHSTSQEPANWRSVGKKVGLPPQTVVARVIRELEDDFTHYKSVYVELADQYKVMDAVSDVRRRNMLAQHLREVVDILEQKGDQIASLYDLLTFRDKPVSESAVPDADVLG